jgi:hypothetical protein
MDAHFWRELQAALRADAQRQVERALRVALLLEHGLPQHEIRDRLGLDQAELKGWIRLLRAAAPALEREELPEEFEL